MNTAGKKTKCSSVEDFSGLMICRKWRRKSGEYIDDVSSISEYDPHGPKSLSFREKEKICAMRLVQKDAEMHSAAQSVLSRTLTAVVSE